MQMINPLNFGNDQDYDPDPDYDPNPEFLKIFVSRAKEFW